MATRSVTLPKTETTAHPCPCGCAPCDGTGCQLDGLEQPRFFCGQLLTDQDLTVLLNWAQDKLRLTRYRHGWGVVCGLEVRCDPQQPSRVIVGPGYAVSCCGDDIIVCQDTPIDLSEACREEEDPCAELRSAADPESETAVVTFAGRSYPASEVRTVDLYIGYREELANPQTALGRSVCHEVAECEYSRTREIFTLAWQPVVIGSDPVKAVAQDWHNEYDKCLEVVDKFLQFRSQFGSLADHDEDVRRWLLRWIADHPLHQFYFVRDWVCEMTSEDLTSEAKLVEVLFWLVQDCRNVFLSCECHACQESPGVPLARLWLRATEHQGQRRCNILGIDAYSPYRRPISPECWPAPLGYVNVGQVIWHLWDDTKGKEACTTLADLGVRVAGEEAFVLPATVAELETALDCDLFVPCEGARVVQLIDVAGLGRRVVGFCGTRAQPPPTEPPETEPGEDELTLIHGIGSERALRLREAGITTFAALAETPIERLQELYPNVNEKALHQWQDEARDLAN